MEHWSTTGWTEQQAETLCNDIIKYYQTTDTKPAWDLVYNANQNSTTTGN
jgi:hypothetical protein